jgi:hypothetical protein
MTTTTNGDAPAYPTLNLDRRATGLSKREVFALHAMQIAEPPIFFVGEDDTRKQLRRWARHCWAMADAMLKESEP